jgi:hypothetical protein
VNRDSAYYAERARNGDSCADAAGRCRGCGLPVDRVAEGAANDCEVCNAWLDWYGGFVHDDDGAA